MDEVDRKTARTLVTDACDRRYLFGSMIFLPGGAIVIGFEGVVPDDRCGSVGPGYIYTESGFTFTSPTDLMDVGGILGEDFSNSNGSAKFAFCSTDGDCAGGTFITLASANASSFFLPSIAVGTYVVGMSRAPSKS